MRPARRIAPSTSFSPTSGSDCPALSMPILICGSLAFDTITTFHGRFKQQILPDQLHILNVSFLVPTLRREFGGCAGNIAYTLHQLGGQPVIKATLGSDGSAYLDRLRSWGVPLDRVRVVEDSYTAQAIIITDEDNNQITAFHPGAMQFAHQTPLGSCDDIELAIVAPDGRQAMLQHAEQLAAADIPFVFDPGQGLPLFDGAELRRFIELASWVTVNDYEGRMLSERTGLQPAEISQHVRALIVTLGAQGCEVWTAGKRRHVPGFAAERVVDPTGCGDAFRGALMHGLQQGWEVDRCVELANRVGAIKIAHSGPQNHRI